MSKAEYGMLLSPREKECLQLTARLGKTTLAAKKMGIEYTTAKVNLTRARIKLGANSTIQAAFIALDKGIIE